MEVFSGDRWQFLASKGASKQWCLWASTSTKNPAYPDTLYVDTLIGPESVNTMPLETLRAYRRLGRPELRLERHIAEGCDAREGLERLDVDLDAIAMQLEGEGVTKFIEPFDKLQQWLEERRRGRRAS
jgi:transaldolase